MTLDPSVAAATFDELGQRLHLLAHLLTDDSVLAGELVVQAVLAGPRPSGLQDLSTGIYVAWREKRGESGPIGTGASSTTDIVRRVHTLAADHRAALGLCKYGGHDYRQAAAVMGLTSDRVAQLLCEALRGLGPAGDRHLGPTSAA